MTNKKPYKGLSISNSGVTVQTVTPISSKRDQSAYARKGWATRRLNMRDAKFADVQAKLDAAIVAHPVRLIVTPNPPTLFERIVVRILGMIGIR